MVDLQRRSLQPGLQRGVVVGGPVRRSAGSQEQVQHDKPDSHVPPLPLLFPETQRFILDRTSGGIKVPAAGFTRSMAGSGCTD